MKLGVYAMRDSLTGFLQPTFEQNDMVAIRNFEHAILNAGSILSSHAEDFSLCRIGDFDTETGMIVPLDVPQPLVGGMQVMLRHQEVKSDANK